MHHTNLALNMFWNALKTIRLLISNLIDVYLSWPICVHVYRCIWLITRVLHKCCGLVTYELINGTPWYFIFSCIYYVAIFLSYNFEKVWSEVNVTIVKVELRLFILWKYWYFYENITGYMILDVHHKSFQFIF